MSWYKMHRGWMDNPLFGNDPYSRRDAWVWLIENAVWEPTKVWVAGRAIDLERGQLAYSQRFLADKWGWGRQQVRGFLAKLELNGSIRQNSTRGLTQITIENYCRYQDQQPTNQPQSNPAATQQQPKEEESKNIRIQEYNTYSTPEDWEKSCFALARSLNITGGVVGKLLQAVDPMEAHSVIEQTKGIPSNRRTAYCMGAVKRAKGQPKEKASDKWERNIINSGWERNF